MLKRLRGAALQRPEVIVVKAGRSVGDRLRARLGGAAALLDTAVDPVTLHDVLQQSLATPGTSAAMLPAHESTS